MKFRTIEVSMKRMPSRLSRLLTGGYRLLDLVGLWIDQAFA